MKKPFPLFKERDIFKFASKEAFRMIEENLIIHKHDDDCDTDEEIVSDHIDMCRDELVQRINEFLDGEPLKLIRNIRNEFSGI